MISYPELSKAGRLGNQLWEIAATYGIAVAQLDDPVFPKWDYQPYFSCPDEWFRDFPGPRGREVMYQSATNFVPHMDPRARPYLQDYSLFRGVEKQVKEYFKPSESAETDLDDIWSDDHLGEPYRDVQRPLVSVHVRRGDNVTHPEGYHPLRSWEYYNAALDLTSPDGDIVVFSDDPDWCDKHFEKETGRKPYLVYRGVSRPREYVDRVKYESAPILDWIDLQLMARCDFHVISNSSYAWWGAFLADNGPGTVIHPCSESWFGHHIAPWTDAALMFPESWTPVHDETMGGSVAHVH